LAENLTEGPLRKGQISVRTEFACKSPLTNRSFVALVDATHHLLLEEFCKWAVGSEEMIIHIGIIPTCQVLEIVFILFAYGSIVHE